MHIDYLKSTLNQKKLISFFQEKPTRVTQAELCERTQLTRWQVRNSISKLISRGILAKNLSSKKGGCCYSLTSEDAKQAAMDLMAEFNPFENRHKGNKERINGGIHTKTAIKYRVASSKPMVNPEISHKNILEVQQHASFNGGIQPELVENPENFPSRALYKYNIKYIYNNINNIYIYNPNKENKEKINKKEKKKNPPHFDVSPLFEQLWQAFDTSTKGSKQAALKAFTKLHPTPEMTAQLIEAYRAQKAHKQLRAKHKLLNSAFPHLSTWLNNQRWTDELPDEQKLTAEASIYTKPEPAWKSAQEISRYPAIPKYFDPKELYDSKADTSAEDWKRMMQERFPEQYKNLQKRMIISKKY